MKMLVLIMVVAVGVTGCTATHHAPATSNSLQSSGATRSATSKHFPDTCARGAIRPRGAPFCFDLPTGYLPSKRLDFANGWTFFTAAASGKFDVITVAAINMHQDSDHLSRKALEKTWINSQTMVVGSLGTITAASPVSTLLIDGGRAWEQNVTQRFHGQTSNIRVFTVTRGNTLLSIHCEYPPTEPGALVGCQSVVGDIQIISL